MAACVTDGAPSNARPESRREAVLLGRRYNGQPAFPGLRQGAMANLAINANQYAYVRSVADECVLVVPNCAGSVEPIQLDVDDLGWRDAMQLTPFTAGRPSPVARQANLRPPILARSISTRAAANRTRHARRAIEADANAGRARSISARLPS